MNKEKLAVIYARYSSHNQTEQSIEGQLHDAYEYANKNGYTVIDEYIDRAKTATSDDRPAFQKMIKDSAKHLFEFVIVWKQDRFARNRYDSAVYKRLLKNNGVRVLSVMENISDSPEGVILEGLLEAMAEYYSANLSENIKRGKTETVRKGLFPGGAAPFGYVVQERRLVPDPRTVPVVQEIFRRYADGDRVKDIFNDLSARGIRFTGGIPFKYTSMKSILTNSIYCGEYVFNGQIITGFAPPLIDRELFDRAAARRAFNRRAPAAFRTEETKSLLFGKIYCGECGYVMYGTCAYGAKTRYLYYQCYGKAHYQTGCGAKSIQKPDIEYAVCKMISAYILKQKKRTLEALADSIMEIYQSDIDTSELEMLEKQKAHIESDLNKLVDSLITMPESARPRIAQRMNDLEQQLKELLPRIARKKAETQSYFSKADFVNSLRITFEDLHSRTNQQFIIDHFINSVYVYGDGRVVVYLNRINGLPTGPDDSAPGKDSWRNGKRLPIPPETLAMKEFYSCSSLYRFTQVNTSKEELPPLFFFLHGHIGIMFWRQPIKNILIRNEHGRIIRQEKPVR